MRGDINNQMNNRVAILLISLLFILTENVAQDFADKKFYLVDSLVLASVHNRDIPLFDSTLALYHSAPHDTVKLQYLDFIIDNCYSQHLWPGIIHT